MQFVNGAKNRFVVPLFGCIPICSSAFSRNPFQDKNAGGIFRPVTDKLGGGVIGQGFDNFAVFSDPYFDYPAGDWLFVRAPLELPPPGTGKGGRSVPVFTFIACRRPVAALLKN